MVDFTKKTRKHAAALPTDPVAIYDSLDRASDVGPLRPAQQAILADWFGGRRSERDLILKLHTGQGKTLIGLLMLQSQLNHKLGPVLYLCPNKFLVNQTRLQAERFGVPVVTSDGDLPPEFLNGERIYVAPVQKLFNGISKFGIEAHSESVHTIVLDDAHACVDVIRKAFILKIPASHQAYKKLLALFAGDLEYQGPGTYKEIRDGQPEAALPVPYWAWSDKAGEVTEILGDFRTTNEIKFEWPLLKNRITDCFCMVSGTTLEISPYLTPLEVFGSYGNAKHRVFMSATTADDAFLIKGMGLSEATLDQPLVYAQEQWSGEKMVLIPSLIDDRLTRESIITEFAKKKLKPRGGIVVLAPSFKLTEPWRTAGAAVASTDDIEVHVETLREGNFEKTLALANRYDGIDLPDDSCRVLILDSLPRADWLSDRYAERVRTDSDSVLARISRVIEQGLGRSVRGERDYSVILIIGADLVKHIRAIRSRQLLSSYTRQQVEMGLEIADDAKTDIEAGQAPQVALDTLIKQCLGRDSGWKTFYAEQMRAAKFGPIASGKLRKVFATERLAEQEHLKGHHDVAIDVIQELLDKVIGADPVEKGWYLQEMARYRHRPSKADAITLQKAAYEANASTLRPLNYVAKPKAPINLNRTATIAAFMHGMSDHQSLMIEVDAVLSDLAFGTDYKKFERAFAKLGEIIGFPTSRPEEQMKEGPDVLWQLDQLLHLLVECKNEVSLDRDEVNKSESGQINNSTAWFKAHYSGQVVSLMVTPAKRFGPAAACGFELLGLGQKGLKRLSEAVRSFFNEFQKADLKNIPDQEIQDRLELHGLAPFDIRKFARTITPAK